MLRLVKATVRVKEELLVNHLTCMYSTLFFITIRNVNIIPLHYKATSDSHLYEDIEKYQTSDIASNKEQDISTVACPAYVTVHSTDKDPVSICVSEFESVQQ